MIKQFLSWFRFGYVKTPVKHKPLISYVWHKPMEVKINETANFKFSVIEERPTYQLNELIKGMTPENMPDALDPVEEFVKEVEQKPKRKKSGTKRTKQSVPKRRKSRSAKPRTRSPKR